MANSSSKWGFKTRNFIKPTAKDAVFLNGKSHHPLYIFRGIILSEAKRMRRLNETNDDYLISLEHLAHKCIRSNFPKNLVIRNIEEAKNWSRSDDTSTNKSIDIKPKPKRLPWTTQFTKLLQLDKVERELAPDACVTYCRPATLGGALLKYKSIAHQQQEKKHQNKSNKCGKCGLCGNHSGLKNMVQENQEITTKNGNKVLIKEKLNCKNYGIYAGQCVICQEIYVGQTKNAFHLRWNTHRSVWKKMLKSWEPGKTIDNNSNEQCLFAHYIKEHPNKVRTLQFSDAFKVFFLENPIFEKLDLSESFWITKLNATIN